jgi:hypothetical protein
MKNLQYFILSIALVSLLTGCEEHHLYKYEEYPCKDKVFELQSKAAWVHLGDSYMNGEFFYISRDTLEDYENLVENPHQTAFRIKKIYPANSKFKVLGYYAGVTTPCWSRCGQAFLVQSVEDGNIAWIANYAFDSKECNLVEGNPFENSKNVFGISGYGLGKNQEKAVDIDDLEKKPFVRE